MPQAVTVYRWDDPGAPQLTNRNITEFINILKKCLVEGYGTKDPLGWTLEYEDAPAFKAVFRNNVAAGGSGGYVQVNSSNGTNNSNIAFSLTPAKSMTAVDGFIQPGHRRNFGINTGWTNWLLIGTPIGFYFIAANSSGLMSGFANVNENCFYVGDFESLIPSDAGRFIVVGAFNRSGNDTSTSNNDWQSVFCPEVVGNGSTFPTNNLQSSQLHLKVYDTDNADFFDYYNVAFPGLSNFQSQTPSGTRDITKPLNLFSRGIIGLIGYSSSFMATSLDRDGFRTDNSFTRPAIRGYLPGILCEVAFRYSNQSWPITELIDGKFHWLLRNSYGPHAKYWINMEVW